MDSNFYEVAKHAHRTRVAEERRKYNNIFEMADREYRLFCFWWRTTMCNNDYSESNFKAYLQQTGRELISVVKRIIATKYFDYEAIYDEQNQKWNFYKRG